MSSFIRNNNNWRVMAGDAMDIRPVLPAGTYSAMFDIEQGYFLQTNPNMQVKHKVYGKARVMSDRILNSYQKRPNNTGVLLSGAKGSGKTILAKVSAEKAVQNGMVVVLVNQPLFGPAFNKFLSDIDQPCLIVFDEFEKVYVKPEQQSALLTLFDGMFPSKKLFMVTVNDQSKVNSYMLNRPGRFFYHLRYKGLSEEEIREYCDDNLEQKKHVNSIVDVAGNIRDFSYDILGAMTEELNRYGESVKEVINVLNIDFTQKYGTYDVVQIKKGEKEMKSLQDQVGPINVVEGYFNVSVIDPALIKKAEDKEQTIPGYHPRQTTVTIRCENLVSLNKGVAIFKQGEWYVVLKERMRKSAKEVIFGLDGTEPDDAIIDDDDDDDDTIDMDDED